MLPYLSESSHYSSTLCERVILAHRKLKAQTYRGLPDCMVDINTTLPVSPYPREDEGWDTVNTVTLIDG